MKALLLLVVSIGAVFLIEYIHISYLNSLPKDKRDKLIKKQSEMRCSCGATDFEVVGMKHGKLMFQCKRCKKIR